MLHPHLRASLLWAAVAAVALLSSPAAAAELLAVLELSGDLPDKQRRALTDAVREEATNLTAGTGIKVMTQENMETLLTDMGMDVSCISEGACEVDTLRNLQANYGVTGTVTDFDGTYLVTLQLYEMRTGTMMGAEKVKGSDALTLATESVPEGARKLLGRLPGVGSAAAATAPVAPAPVATAPVTPPPAPVAAPAAAVAVVPGASASGWQPPEMGVVPAGAYNIGERSDYSVTFTRSVEVMVHEVTQGEYQALMGTNPSEFSSCGASCPVETVSWVDAARYANAASAAAGLGACYTVVGDSVTWDRGLSCTGYRLPTESEWEVAARGGVATEYSGSDDPNAVAWTDKNSNYETHPVKQLRPNGYGLYDMSGNVWEWTWDWYAESVGGGVQTDPLGPVSGSFRVDRGGSWRSAPAFARVAFRDRFTPSVRSSNLGFRLARTAP